MAIDAKAARYAQDAHPADDLLRVAEEVGVVVLRDETGQVTAIDNVTGLWDLTKRQIITLHELPTAPTTPVVESSTTSTSIFSRIRGALRAVKEWAGRVVRAARDALAWLAAPLVALAAKLRLNRRGVFYRSRHSARQLQLFTRQRPRPASVVATRRAPRQPADSEPALPEHFVSYLAVVIEAMRGYEDALHPRAGFQYRC